MRKIALFSAVLAAISLAACRGGGDPPPPAPADPVGVFVDAPVQGLDYRSANGIRVGVTNADGEFSYGDGEFVLFSLGGIQLGQALGAAVVLPRDLGGRQFAVNLTRFLLTLDANQDASDGIQLSDEVRSAAASQTVSARQFDASDAIFENSALADFARNANGGAVSRTLVSVNEAQAHRACSEQDVDADGEFDGSCEADADLDGVADGDDACAQTPLDEPADASGCSVSQRDADADGVADNQDLCPATDAGAAVNGQGCSEQQLDADDDGVANVDDECPGSPAGEVVDAGGCTTAQRNQDSDNDGVPDSGDACLLTPSGQEVDERGCSASQRDSDFDGVVDSQDQCDDTEAGDPPDANGCGALQRDTDADTVVDAFDQCPGSSATDVDPADHRGCVAAQRVSTWMNVVPPGANGNAAGGGAQGEGHPDFFTDQLFLYEELAFAPEGLVEADAAGDCAPPDDTAAHAEADRRLACSHFKPAFLKPTTVSGTITVDNPDTGNTVTITRDGWGVPFITAATRQDGMFGVGFVSAQDRLFLHDVLRHVGRGRLSEFLGPEASFYSQDRSVLADGGYSDAELTQIIEATRDKFGRADGELGDLVWQDVNSLVDGINTYISSLNTTRSNERPPEYGTLVPASGPDPWTPEDVVASAVLIQSTFAFGGGGEVNNLRTLQALDPTLSETQRTPDKAACEFWRDVRHANDPDTPQTDPDNAVAAVQSPAVIPEDCEAAWPNGHAALPAGAAIWDVGSFQSREFFTQEQASLPFPQAEAAHPSDQLELALSKVMTASKAIREASEQSAEPLDAKATGELLAKLEYPYAHGLPEGEAPIGKRVMSNFIGVPASETEAGYPIAVAGPQAGYFLSQLLWEVAVVTDDAGPGQLGFAGRGVVFADLPYINIGRGVDFSWSATSGGSDLVDIRVSRGCLLPGSALHTALGGTPAVSDTRNNIDGSEGADGFPDINGYLFDDDLSDGFDPVCRPVVTRTDEWTATPTGASLASGGDPFPEDVRHRVMRTHYGIVTGTATLGGAPLLVSKQRSTFFASLDTAPPFALATTYAVDGPESFFRLFNSTTGTFNWLYSDKEHIAWFHSGLYPKRHPEQHPELPVWGDGRYEWEGAQVDLAADPNFFQRVADDPAAPYPSLLQVELAGDKSTDGYFEFPGFLQTDEHPRVIDPPSGFIHSWNNNPAAGWWAADSKDDYGPIHRANMLRDRMEAFRASGRKHTVATMVEIMADAAHTDLRGFKVVPKALQILDTTSEQELTDLALAQLPNRAALDELLAFLREWTLDGSMDWIQPNNPQRGLGGYRRGPRGDLSGSARLDEANEVSFVYDYRPQVVFSDTWFPQMAIYTLDQIVRRPAGVKVQGIHDDMAQGSAFQAGWYEFLDGLYGQALDEQLGLDGGPGEYRLGTYRQLSCQGEGLSASDNFGRCREGLLRAADAALACLGGFSNRANWDGSTIGAYGSGNFGSCLRDQRVIEQQDQTTHTAISAQTVEPMHWTNRPTYQHAVQVQHARHERLSNDGGAQ